MMNFGVYIGIVLTVNQTHVMMCHNNMLLQARDMTTLLLCIFMLKGSFLMSSQMLGIWLKTYELIWTDSHPEVIGK